MMNDLKFRAWIKSISKMQRVCTLDWNENSIYTISDCVTSRNWEDCEVMQFTGFCDKNGKDIYEGDIVKHSSIIKHVKRSKSYPGAYWLDYQIAPGITAENYFNGNYCHLLGYSCFDDSIEVIGNIYENSNLLNLVEA